MTGGTVRWFDAQNGFGFIYPDGGGKDVFVHRSAIDGAGAGELSDGHRVEFDYEQATRGPQATRAYSV